jgi:hypothetical protein
MQAEQKEKLKAALYVNSGAISHVNEEQLYKEFIAHIGWEEFIKFSTTRTNFKSHSNCLGES